MIDQLNRLAHMLAADPQTDALARELSWLNRCRDRLLDRAEKLQLDGRTFASPSWRRVRRVLLALRSARLRINQVQDLIDARAGELRLALKHNSGGVQ